MVCNMLLTCKSQPTGRAEVSTLLTFGMQVAIMTDLIALDIGIMDMSVSFDALRMTTEPDRCGQDIELTNTDLDLAGRYEINVGVRSSQA